MNLIGGLPAVCGSSFSKARSCCFGLFLFVSELNGKKTGMKRIKRIFQILQEERELYGELKTKHNFNTQHNMIISVKILGGCNTLHFVYDVFGEFWTLAYIR